MIMQAAEAKARRWLANNPTYWSLVTPPPALLLGMRLEQGAQPALVLRLVAGSCLELECRTCLVSSVVAQRTEGASPAQQTAGALGWWRA